MKASKSEAILKAWTEELENGKKNQSILVEKANALQVDVDQLIATSELAKRKLKDMTKALGKVEENLTEKDNLFTEQIKSLQEQLSDAVVQSLIHKDQLEIAKHDASKVGGLRKQRAKLRAMSDESKQIAQIALKQKKNLVNLL